MNVSFLIDYICVINCIALYLCVASLTEAHLF